MLRSDAPSTPVSLASSRLGAGWRTRFERLDRRITVALAAAAIPLLRIALGAVFLWFGALKFFPGLSPAQDLAARTIEQLTFGLVPPAVALPVLASWEALIGVGLLSGRFLRATLLLLAVQMAGALTPLLLFPAETFTVFPIAPTLEGQYILKNVVVVAAAMVVGATVRGGQLQAEPAGIGEPLASPDPASLASHAPPAAPTSSPTRPTEVPS
ncbi:MAG: DoxX family protein [Chloroflexi bacterium]|nr:DoxX family protein [Chloroflexota bacterium]